MNMQSKIVFILVLVTAAGLALGRGANDSPITAGAIEVAETIIDLTFTPEQRDSMIDDLSDNVESYRKLRAVMLANGATPALDFDPVPHGVSAHSGSTRDALDIGPPKDVSVPDNIEELAFRSVRDLAEMIRTKKITSTALTCMYLDRLRRHGPRLECVITLTEDLALEQAKRADEEIAAGQYRGLLHGIPYGAKDLLAVKGYKTTWGSVPYRDQVIDEDAAVIRKLEKAGAVLVAKLTLGALAWGDVWYGGKTRNPWNPEQGSSGSSAGSASATSAGLVAFAIGTETWGSIVSPCTQCGVTGLRPTFGRVSRAGAMALSWSMDKIGPICRSAEDCAIVFDAIRGPDGVDRTVVEAPFSYERAVKLADLRIGYVKTLFEEDYPQRETDAATLETLRELGAELIPIELPDYPIEALAFILSAEAAAAFDELTRSGRDDLMVRQVKQAWPNVFRSSRFIPAVEYIQANRIRYLIMREMERLGVDVYAAPSFGGNNLLLTNLTGHPCVVVPNGFDGEGNPVSVSFIGRLFDEGTLIAVAQEYQDATAFDEMHPPLFSEVNTEESPHEK